MTLYVSREEGLILEAAAELRIGWSQLLRMLNCLGLQYTFFFLILHFTVSDIRIIIIADI